MKAMKTKLVRPSKRTKPVSSAKRCKPCPKINTQSWNVYSQNSLVCSIACNNSPLRMVRCHCTCFSGNTLHRTTLEHKDRGSISNHVREPRWKWASLSMRRNALHFCAFRAPSSPYVQSAYQWYHPRYEIVVIHWNWTEKVARVNGSCRPVTGLLLVNEQRTAFNVAWTTYSLVQWNWLSGVTGCTWISCIQRRQRSNFTAPGCMWFTATTCHQRPLFHARAVKSIQKVLCE